MLNRLTTRIKNIFIFIFFFIISCIKLLLDSVFAVIRVKDALTDGTYWFAVLYQPFLLLILMAFFAEKIDGIINSIMVGEANFVYIIFLLFILIALIFFINTIIEFIYRIRYSDDFFTRFFSLQQHAHNYMMAIISLTAIYAAIDAINADEINTMLLVFGILIFICIAITDLYKTLFISQDVVKNICAQFKDQYSRYKQ